MHRQTQKSDEEFRELFICKMTRRVGYIASSLIFMYCGAVTPLMRLISWRLKYFGNASLLAFMSGFGMCPTNDATQKYVNHLAGKYMLMFLCLKFFNYLSNSI